LHFASLRLPHFAHEFFEAFARLLFVNGEYAIAHTLRETSFCIRRGDPHVAAHAGARDKSIEHIAPYSTVANNMH